MNLNRVKLVKEHESHYEMHDGNASFRVPKAGLSEATHAKIRKMAEGGKVGNPEYAAKMKAASEQAEGENAAMVARKWDEKRKSAQDSALKENVEFSQRRAQHFADGGTAHLSVDELHSSTPAEIAAALSGAGGYGMPAQPSGGAPDAGVPNISRPVSPGEAASFAADEQKTRALQALDNPLSPSNQATAKRNEAYAANTRPAPLLGEGGLPPGVRKAGEKAPASEAEAPVPPAKPIAITGSSGPLPGVTDETNAIEEERAAIEAKGRLQAEEAKQTAAALAEGDKVLRAHELAQKEIQTRAHATAEDLMRKHEAATAELQNQDTSVDPGRFWASRSTSGKIAGILGLALGALGAGSDGVNRAASMLTGAIDRDIEAQKAEHTLRLQKGRAAVDAAQSMYAMNHQIFQNDLAAEAAAHATAWARVDNNLKRIVAAGAGPQAQAAAAQLSALSLEKQAKFKSDAANIAADNITARIVANADAIRAGASAGKAGVSKVSELAKGAHEAANELEQEFIKNPTSPRIGQLRASLMLHLNKLQGGRFNEEIHAMNESLIPGNEGASAVQRVQGVVAPDMVRKKFEILRKHIDATANAPPNPDYPAQ